MERIGAVYGETPLLRDASTNCATQPGANDMASSVGWLIRSATMTSQGSSLGVMLAASAVFLVPLALYTAAYFACTMSWGSVPGTGGKCRVYRTAWMAIAFMPASCVESAATGRDIHTAWTTR